MLQIPLSARSWLLFSLFKLSVNAASGADACSYIEGFSNACASAYSDFQLLPFATQASCLCYSSTAWVPDNYDQAFTSCGNYLETAFPADYASITSVGGGPLPTAPCRDAGNVRSITEVDDNQLACSQIQNVVAGCSATYSGFDGNAPFVSNAPCFCYRDGDPNSYIGPIYDSSVAKCWDYISTADSAVYNSAKASNGGQIPQSLCQSVKALPTSSSSKVVTTSTAPTPGNSPSPIVQDPTTTTPIPKQTPVVDVETSSESSSDIPLPSKSDESGE